MTKQPLNLKKLSSTFFYMLLCSLFFFAQGSAHVYADESTCRQQIERLFNFTDIKPLKTGQKCHPPVSGCEGCAEEVITEIRKATVSLNSSIVTIPYHVERVRVWGKCPGVKWNDSPDPEGPINSKIEISYTIQDGRMKLDQTREVRSNMESGKPDTRPSWAFEKVEAIVRTIDGTPVDCP